MVVLFRTFIFILWGGYLSLFSQHPAIPKVIYNQKSYFLYPKKYEKPPALSSPFLTNSGEEIIVSSTKEGKFILLPVTLKDIPGKWKQLQVDTADFPTLAKTGLHSFIELNQARSITGRSVAEITELGRPGRLSSDGFMSEREDILSVLIGDNRLVQSLGLTHAVLAKPLLHTYNLVQKGWDIKNLLKHNRHTSHYPYFLYNGKKIFLKINWTKGGQQSIFNDEITGAWAVWVWRALDKQEEQFLNKKYHFLGEKKLTELKHRLSHFLTSEMEPFYVQRYGFYEGHTEWRTDPLVISFIFGLKSIKGIESLYPGKIYQVLTAHHTREETSEVR
jgi:hypothetical protein